MPVVNINIQQAEQIYAIRRRGDGYVAVLRTDKPNERG
jgi:hypothetical protein